MAPMIGGAGGLGIIGLIAYIAISLMGGNPAIINDA